MSVIALRTRNLNGANDIVATANLRNLQLLLNAAKHHVEYSGSSAVYGNLVILALVLINAAISNQIHEQDSYGLANQAATIALSVSESLGVPTPNLGLLTEQDTRRLESLRIHIQDVERCLTTALPVLLGTTGASSGATFFEPKGKRSGVRRVSSQLQRAFDAFSLKLSILGSSQALHSRRMLHGVDADADVFTWQQVDLQSECEIPMTFFPVDEQFWGNTYEGVIDGTKAVVKTYPGREFEAFRKDLEIMRTSRHTNLPSLLGYSKPGAAIPFIAISMESYTPLLDYFPILCKSSPNTAVREAWKLVLTIQSTLEHLCKEGMMDDLMELRNGVETAVVDNSGKLILTPRGPTSWSSFGTPAIWATSYLHLAFSTLYEKMNRSGGFVDHLPRALRPLRYVLKASQSVPLPSTSMGLDEAVAQLLQLDLRRGLPLSSRSMVWPLSVFGKDYQPVVGDIGRFVYNSLGQASFIQLVNVQREIGGYMLSTQSRSFHFRPVRLSQNEWKFPHTPHEGPHTRSEWETVIPVEMALRFLAANARLIGRTFDVPPEDLVFVHQSMLFMDNEISTPKAGWEAFTKVHLDEEGRLSRLSRFKCPVPYKPEDAPHEDLPAHASSEWYRIPSYVQVEKDEVQDDPSIVEREVSCMQVAIGDIGYFMIATDGGRYFTVLHNAADDIQDLDCQPWERNTCESIGGGVWRSPPIDSIEGKNLCFSWTTTASPGIPRDFRQFWIYYLASEGGSTRLPVASEDLWIVLKVYHQVQATFSPQPDNTPLRLFVHFNERGIPAQAYWSEYDQLSTPPAEMKPRPGCVAQISHSISEEEQLTESGSTFYRRVGDPTPPTASTGPDQSLGCVGHWVRDPNGLGPLRWRTLGSISLPARNRQLVHCASPGYLPASQVTRSVWRARMPWAPYDIQDRPEVHSGWIEELPALDPAYLSEFVDDLCQKHGVDRSDLLIVSKVVTNLYASASSQALEEDDIRRREKRALYLARKNSQVGNESLTLSDAGKPVPNGFADNDGDASILPSEKVPPEKKEDEDGFHDLRLYAVLPLSGGCFGFWSCDKAPRLNVHALSKLDLGGWQRVGCHVRTSIDLERTSIIELLNRD